VLLLVLSRTGARSIRQAWRGASPETDLAGTAVKAFQQEATESARVTENAHYPPFPLLARVVVLSRGFRRWHRCAASLHQPAGVAAPPQRRLLVELPAVSRRLRVLVSRCVRSRSGLPGQLRPVCRFSSFSGA
jgi:hypothetical protein